mmetsp:Transcript_43161/g.101897  ORF Transcript_43161/g.101897 Transcript_43161/m.101897 type:complete len:599 (-) Transcript_43161:245-2041(-)
MASTSASNTGRQCQMEQPRHFSAMVDGIVSAGVPSITRMFSSTDPGPLLTMMRDDKVHEYLSDLYLSPTSDEGLSTRPLVYVAETDKDTAKAVEALRQQQVSSGAEGKPFDLVVLPETSFADRSFAKYVSYKPGILVLQPDTPFLVPGGRFNELYGWDSYFMAAGLAAVGDPALDALAKGTVTQLLYQVKHFGKILNANRSYFLNRSQPPFTTSAIGLLGSSLSAQERADMMELALAEYRTVWMSADGGHLDPATGLNKYGGSPVSLCLAVEDGGYDHTFQTMADARGMPVQKLVHDIYRGFGLGRDTSIVDAEIFRTVADDLAMRESGHDTSARVARVASVLAPACLNCLLYKTELDLGLCAAAAQRKAAMNALMWDEERGIFADFNLCDQRREQTPPVVTPAGVVYPLWAGLASAEQAQRLRHTLVTHLEQAGGVVGTSQPLHTVKAGSPSCSSAPSPACSSAHQWDWPWGWAPHQMMAWDGLLRYGFEADARRLAFRWCRMLAEVHARPCQCVPEKFDVVAAGIGGDAAVSTEYGTQCVGKGEYFGWSLASVLYATHHPRGLLSPQMRALLERLGSVDEMLRSGALQAAQAAPSR